MDRPMPELLALLPLADDLVQALLSHSGALGVVLQCVLAYEQGDWETLSHLGYPCHLLVNAYSKLSPGLRRCRCCEVRKGGPGGRPAVRCHAAVHRKGISIYRLP